MLKKIIKYTLRALLVVLVVLILVPALLYICLLYTSDAADEL